MAYYVYIAIRNISKLEKKKKYKTYLQPMKKPIQASLASLRYITLKWSTNNGLTIASRLTQSAKIARLFPLMPRVIGNISTFGSRFDEEQTEGTSPFARVGPFDGISPGHRSDRTINIQIAFDKIGKLGISFRVDRCVSRSRSEKCLTSCFDEISLCAAPRQVNLDQQACISVGSFLLHYWLRRIALHDIPAIRELYAALYHITSTSSLATSTTTLHRASVIYQSSVFSLCLSLIVCIGQIIIMPRWLYLILALFTDATYVTNRVAMSRIRFLLFYLKRQVGGGVQRELRLGLLRPSRRGNIPSEAVDLTDSSCRSR